MTKVLTMARSNFCDDFFGDIFYRRDGTMIAVIK